jgi:UMF1 family MFS transporter
VTLMGGRTSSLRVAVGVSAIWWAVFTIPAWRGLPGGLNTVDQHRSTGASSLAHGWKRVAKMIKPSEIKSLPNLFTFLLAWIFLSDGMSPYNLDTTALTIRFPHHNIHCDPLRLFHPPNGSI